MRRLVFLVTLLFATPAFAQYSLFEFSIPHDGQPYHAGFFRLFIHQAEPDQDYLQKRSERGEWVTIFRGEINHLELPTDATTKDVRVLGKRGVSMIYTRRSYDLLTLSSGGIRFRSRDHLVLDMALGTVVLPWHGEILEVRDLDFDERAFSIISVKGTELEGTYLVLKSFLHRPYMLSPRFTSHTLDAELVDGEIDIGALHKKIDVLELVEKIVMQKSSLPWVSLYEPHAMKPPEEEEILEEWIALLDFRELLMSWPNGKTIATKAIREILIRAIPELKRSRVKEIVGNTSDLLADLWMNGRIPDGAMIKRIAENRLKLRSVENCELALMPLTGPGSHAATFVRGQALRNLNSIYRKIRSE